MKTVILFYKYIAITYPKRVLKWQQKICSELGLKGRVLIAHEGINGTLSGTQESIERYVEIMRNNEEFSDIDFKQSSSDNDCFPNLYIAVKPEIVRLAVDSQDAPLELGGIHLTPEQTHAMLTNKPKDLVILDTRNLFESAIGTFKDAIKAPINNFRDLPKYIDETLDQFKDKPVLMFCTGGVRCERASAYLKNKQVAKEVYQIEGGIHRYAEKYPDGYFRGKNYVFDSRIALKVNDDILGSCFTCNKPCDEYTNCINAKCNRHFINCSECMITLNGACSTECHTFIASNKEYCRPPLLKARECLPT